MSAAPGTAPNPPPAQHWRGLTRVLAVRLDNLGDLLMTTPALAALRESLPRAHIGLLTSPTAAAAAPHLPMVDSVWPLAAPWVAVGRGAALQTLEERRLIEQIAAQRFEAAVIFTVCTQSALPAALWCRQAGIPWRLAHCRENPYALLSHWVPDPDRVEQGHGLRHEVRRQLELLAHVGLQTVDERLRFALRPCDRRAAAGHLANAGLRPGQPYVVLHPGASAPSRRWPAPALGAAGQAIAHRSGCALVLTGGVEDMAALALVRQHAGPAALTLDNGLSLGELAAVIEGARLLVANNSAPAHLAAAVGTPVVAAYALTNPQHTPWLAVARVLSRDMPCRWCLKSVCPCAHHGCLRGVGADEVADAAIALLQRRSEEPAPLAGVSA